MNKLVINIYGSPGAGKSTLANRCWLNFGICNGTHRKQPKRKAKRPAIRYRRTDVKHRQSA